MGNYSQSFHIFPQKKQKKGFSFSGGQAWVRRFPRGQITGIWRLAQRIKRLSAVMIRRILFLVVWSATRKARGVWGLAPENKKDLSEKRFLLC